MSGLEISPLFFHTQNCMTIGSIFTENATYSCLTLAIQYTDNKRIFMDYVEYYIFVILCFAFLS